MKSLHKAVYTALLTATSLLLIACSFVTAGTVIDKEHRDAYEVMRMQCVAYNKDGLCTQQMPVWDHYPEAWYVTLQDENGDTGKVKVTEYTYDRLEAGDYYDKDAR